MNILIVKKIGSDIHGTVTLALRLYNYFNNNGHNCYLTKYKNSSFLLNLPEPKKLIEVNEWNVRTLAKKYQSLSFDVIYCLTSDDAIIGLQLQNLFYTAAKVFLGIYHPRQSFVPTKFLPNYKEHLNKKVFNLLPAENIIFMDEVCHKSHSQYYNLSLKKSPIIPLPMNIEGQELSSNYIKYKFSSVGRITDFKPYPFGVIKAIANLKERGYKDMNYHIVGEGENFGQLKKMIEELSLQNYITLYGSVPYTKINDIIKDSYCFIGMGTTVGEASGIGLPSLVAIVDDVEHTYGLLGNLPENIVGEPGENLPLFNYSNAIEKLLQLSDDDYKKERRKSIEKAAFYSIEKVGKKFIEHFARGKNSSIKISWFSNLLFLLTKIQVKYFIQKEFRHK